MGPAQKSVASPRFGKDGSSVNPKSRGPGRQSTRDDDDAQLIHSLETTIFSGQEDEWGRQKEEQVSNVDVTLTRSANDRLEDDPYASEAVHPDLFLQEEVYAGPLIHQSALDNEVLMLAPEPAGNIETECNSTGATALIRKPSDDVSLLRKSAHNTVSVDASPKDTASVHLAEAVIVSPDPANKPAPDQDHADGGLPILAHIPAVYNERPLEVSDQPESQRSALPHELADAQVFFRVAGMADEAKTPQFTAPIASSLPKRPGPNIDDLLDTLWLAPEVHNISEADAQSSACSSSVEQQQEDTGEPASAMNAQPASGNGGPSNNMESGTTTQKGAGSQEKEEISEFFRDWLQQLPDGDAIKSQNEDERHVDNVPVPPSKQLVSEPGLGTNDIGYSVDRPTEDINASGEGASLSSSDTSRTTSYMDNTQIPLAVSKIEPEDSSEAPELTVPRAATRLTVAGLQQRPRPVQETVRPVDGGTQRTQASPQQATQINPRQEITGKSSAVDRKIDGSRPNGNGKGNKGFWGWLCWCK